MKSSHRPSRHPSHHRSLSHPTHPIRPYQSLPSPLPPPPHLHLPPPEDKEKEVKKEKKEGQRAKTKLPHLSLSVNVPRRKPERFDIRESRSNIISIPANTSPSQSLPPGRRWRCRYCKRTFSNICNAYAHFFCKSLRRSS